MARFSSLGYSLAGLSNPHRTLVSDHNHRIRPAASTATLGSRMPSCTDVPIKSDARCRRVDLNHRPLGYEPSTLSLIWRNLTSFWAVKVLLIGPNFGPKSLLMTESACKRRYANLMTEDLQAIHQRVSLRAA